MIFMSNFLFLSLFSVGVYYLMVSEGRKAYLLFSNIKEEVGAYEDPNKGIDFV